MQLESVLISLYQKQPSRGALRKKSSVNMQQQILYREHPCQSAIYWSHTLTWVFSCKFSELFLRTRLDRYFCCIPSLSNKYSIFCESKLNLFHNRWLFAKYVLFVCLLHLSLNLFKLHYFHWYVVFSYWKYITAMHWYPPPLIKQGEGRRSRTFQKLSHQGVPKILLERGDKPEKEGGW